MTTGVVLGAPAPSVAHILPGEDDSTDVEEVGAGIVDLVDSDEDTDKRSRKPIDLDQYIMTEWNTTYGAGGATTEPGMMASTAGMKIKCEPGVEVC